MVRYDIPGFYGNLMDLVNTRRKGPSWVLGNKHGLLECFLHG